MQNFIKPGNTLGAAAPYQRNSGQGALIGSLFGVATSTVANGATVEFALDGVYDLDSDTGTAWSVGDLIYWDNTAKGTTKTSTSNKLIGACVLAKASGATTGRVRLNGVTVS